MTVWKWYNEDITFVINFAQTEGNSSYQMKQIHLRTDVSKKILLVSDAVFQLAGLGV
jgi:hypothetical protein